MEKYLYLSELSSLLNLFERKEKELICLINTLFNHERRNINNETDFKNNIRVIKNHIILKPVIFNKIKILAKQNFQRRITILTDKPQYVVVEVNSVAVEFKYEGSIELFGYFPDNFSMNGYQKYYLPQNDRVIILIDKNISDEEEIMKIANSKMELNFLIFEQINPEIVKWSEKMDIKIDDLIRNRRNKLKE